MRGQYRIASARLDRHWGSGADVERGAALKHVKLTTKRSTIVVKARACPLDFASQSRFEPRHWTGVAPVRTAAISRRQRPLCDTNLPFTKRN